MRFIVMSDIHYISQKSILNDKISSVESKISAQSLIDVAAYDDIDTILITGDLTDRGDKNSHLDFLELLKDLKAKGKKVYVTTATHDFCHHGAYTRKRGDTDAKYVTEPWSKPFYDEEKENPADYLKEEYKSLPKEETTPILLECFSPEEIWKLYYDFGPKDAYSVEEGSFSYCIDLDENTRCLMLNDNFRNEECLHDISVTYSPKCLRWINEMVKEAKRDGKFIFACTHHPLLPPSPAYRIGAGNRDMRSPYSLHTLADMGINLALTGHSHFSDVGFGESEKGNVIWDITTPSVRHYPPRYRIIDLDGKNGTIEYKCVSVTKPADIDIEEDNLEAYYHNMMYNEYLSKMQNLKSPLNKIITEKTVKDFYFICKGASGLSKDEYNKIKDVKIFDLIVETAFNMLRGDGQSTPDTPEYKFLMGLSAVLDSIIDTQPFVNLKKNTLKGYSVSDIISELCFNNYCSDNEDKIDFTKKPEEKYEITKFKSRAGDKLMFALSLLAIILSPLSPIAAVVAIPAMTISKKKKLKNNPEKPNYIY